MVYLDLSILNLEETINFYCEILDLFRSEEERLVCNCGADLVMNLIETSTDEHGKIFGSPSHVKASFSIHRGTVTYSEYEQLNTHLKDYGVLFEVHSLHVALAISLLDPSGNRVEIIFEVITNA